MFCSDGIKKCIKTGKLAVLAFAVIVLAADVISLSFCAVCKLFLA
jgi:hypothetical protein